MRSIRETCRLRGEVLKGDLQDAIFAADFGYVLDRRPPDVYSQPVEFFRNTHPAASLKKIVATIFSRLADPNEAGAAIRLSTGFGGGKTHTLIALWHLAKNITKATLGTELLPAAGRPERVVVAGIDASKFGSTICASHGRLETHSLWSELAYLLGGESGYARMKHVDNPNNVPNAEMVRDILPDEPVLILLDELVIYMAALNEQGRGALLAFLNLLIAEVGARRQAIIVMTDPAGQAAYQKEAAALADVVSQIEAARRLDEVLGRKTTDFDPIGKEAARVIIRRLFEWVDSSAAEETSAEYFSAYKRVATEYADALPPEAATLDYAKRIVECYPFHPRLLDTAQNRLGALQDFHKSRGTLRLFARILRDSWESETDVSLITAGALDWTSDRIQADLLQRLNKDSFKAAVDADVVGHAGQLDKTFSTDIHRRVASALLLESLPMTPSAAMDKRDLTLAVLRPSDVGHEPGEAIDRLMSVCWHTYKDDSGRKFQFRYEPNVNRLIDERTNGIPIEDAKQAVLTLAQNYFKGHTFTLVAYPSSPRSVADSAELKLVLSDTEQLAQAVCDYEDNTDPAAKRIRRFRNAIFGISPARDALTDAVQVMRRLRAAEEISKEQDEIARQKKQAPLKEQLDALIPLLRRRTRIRAIRAFNRVVFQGKPSVTLDEKYLVSEESALESITVNGQARIKEFLDDNKLVYQPTDALDVDLLLDNIIKGATPSLEHDGAYPASAVHERALSNDRLRLMMDGSPVRNAIIKAVEQDKLVVRLPSGDVYETAGCVTGSASHRKRIEGRKLTTFNLASDVLLAPISAPCVQDWLKVSEEGHECLTPVDAAGLKYTTPEVITSAIADGHLDGVFSGNQRLVVNNERFQSWQPTVSPQPLAYTWDEAVGLAAKLPLLSLKLTASNLEAARKLVQLAQPFGARSLTLSVRSGGDLKDGGTVNFSANNLRYNHPLKPIDVAATLLRAMNDSATFEAELALYFGEDGSKGTAARFEEARKEAAEGVRLMAEFGEEGT